MKLRTVEWNRYTIEEILLEEAKRQYGNDLRYANLWVGEDGYAEYEMRVEEKEEND